MKSNFYSGLAALLLGFGLISCAPFEDGNISERDNPNEIISEKSIEQNTNSTENQSRYSGTFQGRLLTTIDVILVPGMDQSVFFDGSMPQWGELNYKRYWYGQTGSYLDTDRDYQSFADIKTLLGGNPRVQSTTSSGGKKIVSIVWSSADRLRNGVLKSMIDQLRAQDVCVSRPCIAVSHSTGGLVMDYLLAESKKSYGTPTDFSEIYYNTILNVNLASATGGSELASLAKDFAFGACAALPGEVMNWLFKGVECGARGGSLGILNDLVPNVARSLNQASLTYTPTLMVAGTGANSLSEKLSAQFLPGTNDSVVPLHSSCGDVTIEGIESCSSKIVLKLSANLTKGGRYNYKRDCLERNWLGTCKTYSSYYYDDVATGPTGVYAYHYPWIMSEGTHFNLVHSENASAKEVLLYYGHSNDNYTTAQRYSLTIDDTAWSDWVGNDFREISDDQLTVLELVKKHLSF
ncbi:MAG: hypothetical protein HQM12_17320 [SAR324 cluster bacterium]|nr:hypothetical protein [SAR324 cluster bacterium]MBF0350464.1 hypothetical protein [SAR324 cluster bacterium]